MTTLVGRLRATLGDYAGADAAFDEAVAHCRSTDAKFFLAEALLYQALARRDAGGSDQSLAGPLTEALELSTAGGYGTLRRRAEQALT